MANYKPSLTNVSAFDATIGITFSFGWKGAQAFYNELIIKDSETLDIVYKYKIKTMALKHVMDITSGTSSPDVSGSFTNGRQYQATLIVYDKNNEACGTSDPITFWCYSSPTFSITNTDVLSGIITMSSFYLNLEYSQSEGEILKEYTVSVYDVGRNLLSQSPVFTVISSSDALVYRIEGLTNQTYYYIKADGITYHGMNVSTGYIPFAVKYDKMGVGAKLTAKNIGDGTITISSNFKVTDASSYPSPAVYIDKKEIDLTSDGYYVDFFDGINSGRNFEIKIHMRDMRDGAKIRVYSETTEFVISLEYFYPDVEMSNKKYYFKLSTNDGSGYSAFTKLFDMPSSSVYIDLVIASSNGYYSILMKINE